MVDIPIVPGVAIAVAVAVAIAVLIIAILFSGCAGEAPAVNNTTSTPVTSEATPRPNVASPDTRAANGHVYLDGKPVVGASVVAVSSEGSDSLLAMTDSNGSYILNIKPDMQYNATAYYNGLKRTIFPLFLHGTRNVNYNLPGRYGVDVADQYDIALAYGHNATIAGNTRPGYILVNATPVAGGPTLTAVSNYTGWYAMDVQPGVAYRLSGKDYYEQLRLYLVTFFSRNGDAVETVTVGPDETMLIDMSSLQPV